VEIGYFFPARTLFGNPRVLTPSLRYGEEEMDGAVEDGKRKKENRMWTEDKVGVGSVDDSTERKRVKDKKRGWEEREEKGWGWRRGGSGTFRIRALAGFEKGSLIASACWR